MHHLVRNFHFEYDKNRDRPIGETAKGKSATLNIALNEYYDYLEGNNTYEKKFSRYRYQDIVSFLLISETER